MHAKRIEYVDGSCAEIDTAGHWDLCLPNGEHVRGIATDAMQARELVERAHNSWALERWNKGTLAKGQLFICSLR
jgi:hypothetical protein